jgi:hypothetical protein
MRALLTIAALLVAGLVASPSAIAAHGHPGHSSVVRHGYRGPAVRQVPVYPHHLPRHHYRYPPRHPYAYPPRYYAPAYPGCSPYGVYGRSGFGYHGSRFSLYFGF